MGIFFKQGNGIPPMVIVNCLIKNVLRSLGGRMGHGGGRWEEGSGGVVGSHSLGTREYL